MSERDFVRLVRENGVAAPEPFRQAERPSSTFRFEEALPLQTELREDGLYESRFTLALDSFVPYEPGASAAAAYDVFVLEHIFAALEPGQQIEFVLRRDTGEGNVPSIRLAVRGVATGATDPEAASGAQLLHSALRRLLAARGDCDFVVDSTVGKLFSHAFRVEVGGILLVTDAGPSAKGPAVQPVVVPAMSLVEARVPFWDALLACSFPVELQVSVAPTRLEGAALLSVAHAYRALEARNLRCETLPERAWLNREQIRLLRGHVETELARWLTLSTGVRIEIVLRTPDPVPAGALRWLAQTLLPMRRIEVLPHACGLHGQEPCRQSVDLRHCLNESKVMPALLPDRAAVRLLGLPRRFAAPKVKLPDAGLLLGLTGERQVRWSQKDRARHCYIVGATGCGKSSLLLGMIRQDIEAGEGVAVIDPHGDLYRGVLESIPARRAADVVLFDPADHERAVGLNYLEIPGANPAVERSFVANEMIGIFDRRK